MTWGDFFMCIILCARHWGHSSQKYKIAHCTFDKEKGKVRIEGKGRRSIKVLETKKPISLLSVDFS